MSNSDHTIDLTIAEVEKIAQLSRLALTDEEKQGFAKDISGILSYVSQIQEVASGETVDRTSKEQYPHRNIMREDISSRDAEALNSEPLNPDPQILVESAPRHTDGYVQVKKILGGSQ